MVLIKCTRPKLCLFYLCILSVYFANPFCNAFRLRRKEVGKSIAIDRSAEVYDLSEENDEDLDDSMEIEDLEELEDDPNDDNDDDDDDDQDKNVNQNDDDDESQELEASRKRHAQLFKKVHKVRYDLPIERKKYVRQHISLDESGIDDTDIEDGAINIFSKLFNLFGFINRKPADETDNTDNDDDDHDDDEESDVEPKQPLVTSQKTTKTIETKVQDDSEQMESKQEQEKKSWRDYLKELPLGPIKKFFSELDSEEDDDDDDEPVFHIEVPKNIKPTDKIIEDIKNSVKQKVAEKSNRNKKKQSYPPLPRHEFENLLINIPSFVPNYTKIYNFECRYQGQIFERQLRGKKPWTLQMIDASARISSGLLRGNINQLGDYDMCTGIGTKIKITEQDVIEIRGKYCLAHIDFYAIDENLKAPLNLIQGKGFVKSTIDDPVHFIPRFTTTNWGMCLPSGCDHEDAERILSNFLKPYNCTGLRVKIDVDPDNCHIEQPLDYAKIVKETWQISATLLFYTFCIVCTLIATLSDYYQTLKLDKVYKALVTSKADDAKEPQKSVKEENKVEPEGILNRTLMAFSLKKSFPLLFNVDGTDEEQITCVHGIKAFGTILLFTAFRMIPLGRIPFDNRNQMTELFNNPFSIILRALFLYTDLFLLLSGLLCSYGVVKDIKSNGKINVFKRILGRVVRLVPTLLAVLLFYAFIWDYIGNGPQWGDLVTKNSELCRENMWRNLLFIQNWTPFEDMCATHTFQLAIDMQLYIITPLLVWMFYKSPLLGLGAYGMLHGFSTGARFTAVADNRLSLVLFHGMKLSQIYRTANQIITPTIHRATPYLIGIGLGVVLRDIEKNIKIPKPLVFISWISSILGITWCFWSPSHLADRTYQYDSSEAAQYAAMASLVFSVSIAWIVFACNFGYGSFINKLLSSKPMILLSRLSYTIYLIEFLVFFTFAARQRTVEHFELDEYFNYEEVGILIGAALLLTLVIDLPMQNVRRIILGSSNTNTEVKEEELKEENKEDVKCSHANGNTIIEETEQEPETIGWNDQEEDEEEVYVPQFRKGAQETPETKRVSPREYFKSSVDDDLHSNSWIENSAVNDDYELDASSEEEDESEPEEIPKEPIRPIRQRPTRKFNWDDD